MDRGYWTKQLREPEREFETATRHSDDDSAANELQRAKAASPSALGSLLMAKLCPPEPDLSTTGI
jgi:hypothetical protein